MKNGGYTEVNGMKAKTIKAILRKKVDNWIETVEDVSLQNRLRKNTIVTGGCIASMLLGDEVNDFDIYFRDLYTTRLVAEYYVERFNKSADRYGDIEVEVTTDRVKILIPSDGVEEEAVEAKYLDSSQADNQEYIEKTLDIISDEHEDTHIAAPADEANKQYRPVFLSANAITLSNKIQLVLRFYGEPDQIHGNYDFVHCTNYWTSWDGELYLKPDALESLLSRELRYIGSLYPICSVVRLRKFINRGWRVNAGQILKMAMQISDLDLTDIDVLEDQLTGVDTSYFVQLIKALRDKDASRVDTAYLTTILDRIF